MTVFYINRVWKEFSHVLRTSRLDARGVTDREPDMADQPTLIQSVQRALRLIDTVGASSTTLSAKQLARRTALTLPTAYHLLQTLVHEGYLQKRDGGYVLGDKLVGLHAGGFRHGARDEVHRLLQILRDRVQGGVYLSVFQEGEIVLTEILDPPSTHSVDLWPGVQQYGHATAFGQCILANLAPQDRVDFLHRRSLADLTPHTLTDRTVLADRLRVVGHFACDREEFRLGTACIAFPVRTPTLVGAVALSERAWRYDALLASSEHLRATAAAISRAWMIGE
ncbi:IclR family transcriptional regulator [Mycolicibacterium sp.]|uniref:IclR family transcriptional regulator n=1 Tax=Mycolicibacterium sp. TaxID=2320850 RepID=UPI003D09DF1E